MNITFIQITIYNFSSFAHKNVQLWKCPSPYGKGWMSMNIPYIYKDYSHVSIPHRASINGNFKYKSDFSSTWDEVHFLLFMCKKTKNHLICRTEPNQRLIIVFYSSVTVTVIKIENSCFLVGLQFSISTHGF